MTPQDHANKVAQSLKAANEAIAAATEAGVYTCVQVMELNRVEYFRPTNLLIWETFGSLGHSE